MGARTVLGFRYNPVNFILSNGSEADKAKLLVAAGMKDHILVRRYVEKIIEKFREVSKIPLKYIRFTRSGYTLAEARNRAIIEAEGLYLVFCDERLKMDKEAVEVFHLAIENNLKCWVWGTKNGYKKGFVENFSCIRREDFINGGMFNERVDRYGGMTQEIRTRFEKQGFAFLGIDGANAKSTADSKSKWRKLEEIVAMKDLLYKMYG